MNSGGRESRRAPTIAVLATLLERQLGGHVGLHISQHDSTPLRILTSNRTGKKAQEDANIFKIDGKFVVYSASCGSVARGDFANLKEAGIILLVKSSSGMPFQVELRGRAENLAISGVTSGATARRFNRAIQRLIERSSRKRQRLELRIFRVPSMHVAAVWLHKKRGADVLVPYTPNFAGLRLGRAYNLNQIQSLLRKHGTQMILRWYDRYERLAKSA